MLTGALILGLVSSATAFSAHSKSVRPMTVESLAPGMVIVRGALSESEQRLVLRTTDELGARESNGFAAAGTPGRARFYERCADMPATFSELAIRSSQAASAIDPDMPACAPSHVLINKYTTAAGLQWHRDIYSNDGDEDMPVILLSIGASCRFGVTLPPSARKSKRKRSVVSLHSGDVLLFGGPSRFAEHAVLAVQLGTRPAWMASRDSCRVSLTFRESPSALGREQCFRNFDLSNGVKECFERTQLEWREGDPLAECSECNEGECVLPAETSVYTDV